MDTTRSYNRLFAAKDIGLMEDAFAIEQRSFFSPWTWREFHTCVKRRHVMGILSLVVEQHSGETVPAGFLVYECNRREKSLDILRFAVDPSYRRRGIGAELINNVKEHLTSKFKRVTVDVPETFLGAQKFFRRQGFVATSVLRDWFDNEDAYHMRFSLNAAEDLVIGKYHPLTRFSD